MSAPIDDFPPAAARERIRTAYSPELLRQSGQKLVEVLARHLSAVETSQGKVLNWKSPQDNIADAKAMLAEPPRETSSLEELSERVAQIARTMLARGQNLLDPRYIGHQVPASVPLAGLFDMVGSVTNQVMAIYEMGPWAMTTECALIDALGQQLGFPAGKFAGLVTHGGSLANLTAQLTARNVALEGVWQRGLLDRPQPVMLAHDAVHYSVLRTAGVLGLGTENILRVPLDDRGRMRSDALDDILAQCKDRGQPVVSVTACACATPIGAFDRLNDIADVCEKYRVWLHVDAAHGGAACFSDRYRGLIDGIHRADSVVCDGHKMMFAPALCAFLFYKNRDHRFAAFQQDAPYLFDPSSPGIAEYDSGLKTFECTKRAVVYGLWGLWNTFGPQLFADLVDVTFSMGMTFYQKLRAADDFEPLHEPQCNIVAFRYLPPAMRNAPPEEIGRLQRTLRHHLIESGEYYIVQTTLGGYGALRATIINPLTTEEHLDGLMDAIRRVASDLR